MKITGIMCGILLCSVFLLTGCGGSDSGDGSNNGGGGDSVTVKTDSPTATVQTLMKAMESADKNAFMAVVTGTEEEMKAAESLIDMVSTAKEFKEAVISEWGEEGVKTFGESVDTSAADMDLSDEAMEKLVVQQQEDSAVVRLPDEEGELVLSKVDGKWLVKAIDLIGGDIQAAKMISAMEEILKNNIPNIGKGDYTPESLNEKIGKELVAKMFAGALPMGE